MNVNPIRIRWAERVPPHKIRRLYESDARGLLDEELLDDVGYGIYERCQDIIELREAQRGRVKCRNCGSIILRQTVNGEFDSTEVLKCDQCSWQIACGDYHKSLLRRGPPKPYEPEHLYRSFVQKWPVARSSRDKLLLIDSLIHEFHIHYRAVGTPIGCDVIKATAEELIELIESLAYGPESTGGVEKTKEIWSSRLRAKRMKVNLQAIARELGIQGFSRMRKRALIEAIERADPQRFEAWIRLVHGADQNSPKGDE